MELLEPVPIEKGRTFMPGQQKNPRLIQALTGRDSESIPSSPTYRDIKGKYVSFIHLRLRW